MSARLVIGGVGHLYQGDLDLGRVAVERLRDEDLGPDVVVEEFSYGAVAVAQRLQELAPEVVVLVGAKARGRRPGAVDRRVLEIRSIDPQRAQGAIADAVTGYLDLDLVVDVGRALGALPALTVVIEVEPAATEPAETLTPEAERALAEALALVRDEVLQSTSSRPRL